MTDSARDLRYAARRAKLGWLAVWAATLVVAGWAGGHLGHGEPPPPMAASPGRASLATAPVTPQGREAPGSAEIRAIVREELARQLAELHPQPPAAADPAEPAPEPRPLTAELAGRADDAAGLVERAIAAGRWTRDDRARFASATGDLPPPVRIELERKLHVAINRGAVAILDGFAPFGPPAQAP